MDMKILFKFASRSRPENFFKGLDSIVHNVASDNYLVLCSFDSNDITMNNPAVIEKLDKYRNVKYVFGESTSKIHAINKDMEQAGEWDILVNMSDDMVFTKKGFDESIRKNMTNLDLLLHYPDNYAGEKLVTMTIEGREHYERFEYIYNPSYYSLWCDNEQMEVAQMLGCYRLVKEDIYLHNHYSAGAAKKDELYKRNDTYRQDEEIFKKRKAINFELVNSDTHAAS